MLRQEYWRCLMIKDLNPTFDSYVLKTFHLGVHFCRWQDIRTKNPVGVHRKEYQGIGRSKRPPLGPIFFNLIQMAKMAKIISLTFPFGIGAPWPCLGNSGSTIAEIVILKLKFGKTLSLAKLVSFFHFHTISGKIWKINGFVPPPLWSCGLLCLGNHGSEEKRIALLQEYFLLSM